MQRSHFIVRSAVFASMLSALIFASNPLLVFAGDGAYAFNETDGEGYRAGLKIDAQGNIWGTSLEGGAYGYGNVFKLNRNAAGQWDETNLYSSLMATMEVAPPMMADWWLTPSVTYTARRLAAVPTVAE